MLDMVLNFLNKKFVREEICLAEMVLVLLLSQVMKTNRTCKSPRFLSLLGVVHLAQRCLQCLGEVDSLCTSPVF